VARKVVDTGTIEACSQEQLLMEPTFWLAPAVVAVAEGKPTVRFVIDPVGVLMEMAQYVCDRILSLDEAKRRARELESKRKTLAEHAEHQALSAETMVELLFRDEFRDHRGLVEFMYVYWRLVAEVTDACGTAGPWKLAALRTVEVAAPLLADRCDRAVFEEADALAARLINDGPGNPAELDAALLAAARLRMATRGPEDFAADDYAREGQTTWSARLAADLYRTWFTDEEPFQAESPRLVVEVGELAVRALELEPDGGTRRPRLLALLAQVLAHREQQGGRVHRNAADAAMSALLDSASKEPDLALFLLRVVDGVPPNMADAMLTALFGVPLADVAAVHGRAGTARVISQGVNLARDAPTGRCSAPCWTGRSSSTSGGIAPTAGSWPRRGSMHCRTTPPTAPAPTRRSRRRSRPGHGRSDRRRCFTGPLTPATGGSRRWG
jgi:hypothetical protein